MSIGIIDTSVLCNILSVKHRCQRKDEAIDDLREYVEAEYSLLLPVATIYETGNHIAQSGDGTIRRSTALRFCSQIRDAYEAKAPWVPTPIASFDEMMAWIDEFPDSAMQGRGLGDLSIIKEFQRQCELHPKRRVFIWSFDVHLAGFDRKP